MLEILVRNPYTIMYYHFTERCTVTKQKMYLLCIVGILGVLCNYPVRDDLVRAVHHVYASPEVTAIQRRVEPGLLALVREVHSQAQPMRPYVLDALRLTGVLSETNVIVNIPAQDDLSLNVIACTYTAADIEAILLEYNSPAVGKRIGEESVHLCQETGIDNAYWLWMFVHESGAGSNPTWAGRKPDGSTTGNTGNIICAGYTMCYGRFRDYGGSFSEGTEQHFYLLVCYRDGGGPGCEGLYGGKKHATIADAITTWAPQNENDTQTYADFVVSQTLQARRIKRGEYVTVGGNPQQQVNTEGRTLPRNHRVRSVDLPMDGFGVYSPDTMEQTIRYSITNSPGLQSITLLPGETWSFNEHWTVDTQRLATEYGVLGAGVCDLAARYSNAAHLLGLQEVHFQDHGNVDLALVGPADNVVIWGTPGVAGGVDLTITNTSLYTVQMRGSIEDGSFFVTAWFE